MADVLSVIQDALNQDKQQKKEHAKMMREVQKKLKEKELPEEEGDGDEDAHVNRVPVHDVSLVVLDHVLGRGAIVRQAEVVRQRPVQVPAHDVVDGLRFRLRVVERASALCV